MELSVGCGVQLQSGGNFRLGNPSFCPWRFLFGPKDTVREDGLSGHLPGKGGREKWLVAEVGSRSGIVVVVHSAQNVNRLALSV